MAVADEANKVFRKSILDKSEMEYSSIEQRCNLLNPVKRVVIKAGSRVLSGKNGLNRRLINRLSDEVCDLKEKGIEVIIVSSGAIASGLKKMGIPKKPTTISKQQASAAVGQSSLILTYEKAFARNGQIVAQILITRDDLNHRRRFLNARNTIITLLSWNVIPIINENDTVVVDEIKFGDNDNLSAMVANMTESHLLINLTDIDGLYDKDPRKHKDANLINIVEKVDREIMRYAGSLPGSLGTGGMTSKIKAAGKANLGGVPVIIANGRKTNIIKDIFSGKEIGTLFMPQASTICGRKNWIALTKSIKGKAVIDQGAEKALINRGKSLLPSGIKGVEGNFRLGDSILILNENDKEIGVGMVNYDSRDLKKIIGLKSHEVEPRLGYKYYDEVIHRDNLVITNGRRHGD